MLCPSARAPEVQPWRPFEAAPARRPGHQRQQPLFQGRCELQRHPQIGVTRGQRYDLGANIPIDVDRAEQLEQLASGVHVAAGLHERLPDELDQPLHSRRRWVQAPCARIPLLEHDGASRTEEADMGFHLLRTATERRDLESGVDEVERGRLELACEEVVPHECDVGEASESTNCLAASSIAPSMSAPTTSPSGPTHSLSSRSHPIAPQPTSRTRAPRPSDLVEKAATTGLPHARLELKPFQLRGLIRQEVGLRGHLRAHFRQWTTRRTTEAPY